MCSCLIALRELLDEAAPDIERRGITLLGITISNLDGGDPEAQLALAVPEPADGIASRP
ncbi:MAG: hypothetical protein H0V29_11370 [Thermoleophilaceae bacterium]|nr:hypothetical protein [Thermoleophilaceae bacterium]